MTTKPILDKLKNRSEINWPVLIISVCLILAFVLWGIVDNAGLETVSNAFLSRLIDQWGWMYLAGVLFFVLFCLWLALSKFGNIRLGGEDDRPEYSTLSWFCMLFVCGMGVGLFFWSVSEPILHYTGGPSYAGEPGSLQAAEWALPISFFHWGISAWAVYVVIGLAMAFVLFKKKLPGLMSSCFHPILGDRIHGPVGKAIDIITLVATMLGMCTTIGLGAMQIGAGLAYAFGLPEGTALYLLVILVAVVVTIATCLLPISKGIKHVSNASMVIFAALLLFLLLGGPTKFILDNLFSSLGIYTQNFFQMSLWTDAVGQAGWLGSWTIFYWAWWISWAPFVGMFIARISKGRTVREFILGAVIAPTLLDLIVFGIMGSTALDMELNPATQGVLAKTVAENVARSIYILLEQYPLSMVTMVITIIIIFNFFTVSSESCSIVLATLSSRGTQEPRAMLKIFWSILVGLAAGGLMMMGGLDALQMASIVGAFPFLILMFFICVCIVKFVLEARDSSADSRRD